MEINYKQAKVFLRGMTCLSEYEAKAIDIAIKAIDACISKDSNMIKKYRKKSVTIEAIQWTGKNLSEINDFIGKTVENKRTTLVIHTLEGDMEVSIGDYIIKGVNGEFYPCKPNIFTKTYEEVTK